MTTEAGKRLLAALREHAPWFLGGSAEVEASYVAAIEAEAVAAERARIAEAIEDSLGRDIRDLARRAEEVEHCLWPTMLLRVLTLIEESAT